MAVQWKLQHFSGHDSGAHAPEERCTGSNVRDGECGSRFADSLIFHYPDIPNWKQYGYGLRSADDLCGLSGNSDHDSYQRTLVKFGNNSSLGHFGDICNPSSFKWYRNTSGDYQCGLSLPNILGQL